MRKTAAFCLSLAVLSPALAAAYPNGTPQYVTDAAPFCASCHSAAKALYMPELSAEAALRELPEAKHYGAVRSQEPPSPYLELTEAQREEVVRAARLIDANSWVTLTAPESAKAGGEITVTVKARGGNGPAVGIMLVDRALRFQARPAPSAGWLVSGEPEVRGQDGKPQTRWLDRRAKGASRNLSYMMAEGLRFDPGKGIYPEATVTYRLKAPSAPGLYTLSAAFLYGTENTDKAGFFQRPSGRILFSEEAIVRVE